MRGENEGATGLCFLCGCESRSPRESLCIEAGRDPGPDINPARHRTQTVWLWGNVRHCVCVSGKVVKGM